MTPTGLRACAPDTAGQRVVVQCERVTCVLQVDTGAREGDVAATATAFLPPEVLEGTALSPGAGIEATHAEHGVSVASASVQLQDYTCQCGKEYRRSVHALKLANSSSELSSFDLAALRDRCKDLRGLACRLLLLLLKWLRRNGLIQSDMSVILEAQENGLGPAEEDTGSLDRLVKYYQATLGMTRCHSGTTDDVHVVLTRPVGELLSLPSVPGLDFCRTPFPGEA